MSKKSVSLQVNIPAEFLTTANNFKEFVNVTATVSCDEDGYDVTFKSMTFRGCMAFAIKPECISKFIDMVEDLLILESQRIDRSYAEDEILYYEISQHGI